MSSETRARAEADAARADLIAIGQELQRRLAPRTIISEGMESVREKAEDAAGAARRVAREKPGVVVGIAAVAAGLVAWVPIRRLTRRTKD